VRQIMTDYWKHVDTILMGRKTYAVVAAQDPAGGKNPERARRRTRKTPAVRTYVFSRTLEAIDKPGVELVVSDAAEFVTDLKRRPGREICLMGGGELAQLLLAADPVDRIGLNIHPILLGSGIPAFRDPGHRIKMTLTECRTLEGGCVFANYKVVHAQ
jgi:dihydrofolate reductase